MSQQPGEEPELDPTLGEPDLEAHDREFPAEGPVTVDIELPAGKVDLRLSEEPRVRAELRQLTANQETNMISGLLSWVGERLGDHLGEHTSNALLALHEANIEYDEGERVLRIRPSRQFPNRLVPLHVTVFAPADSTLRVRGGGVNVAAEGNLGGGDLQTGSGLVALGSVTGSTRVQAGTGSVRIGTVRAELRVRTGAGPVSVDGVRDSAAITTGGGDVRIGSVHGEVLAKTGNGDITVAEAHAGTVELVTGSGELRIGLPSGVPAELDLHGAPGRMHSELELSDQRPDTEPAVVLRGKTAGGVTLTKA